MWSWRVSGENSLVGEGFCADLCWFGRASDVAVKNRSRVDLEVSLEVRKSGPCSVMRPVGVFIPVSVASVILLM